MTTPTHTRGSGPAGSGDDAPERFTAARLTAEALLADYRLAVRSREMSAHTRKEVQSGRAKFGSDGGGKELPLLALARHFEPGDWRSGYYRDQTLMLALGTTSVRQFFAQIYAHADLEHEPASGGRQMVTHFASRSLDEEGNWRDLTRQYNSAADLSPTAAQMPRLVGLAQASKLYREGGFPATGFSRDGREIAFGTIGNGSTAEGHFWESINAIGVLGVPAVISVMDDGYAISVTNEHALLGEDLYQLLAGFERRGDGPGFQLFQVRGWDYEALLEVYQRATLEARRSHTPAIVHVTELTQPFGHSSSGSHERYKSAERLEWERAFDPLRKMREWMIERGIATPEQLDEVAAAEAAWVQDEVHTAYASYLASFFGERKACVELLETLTDRSQQKEELERAREELFRPNIVRPRGDLLEAVHRALVATREEVGQPDVQEARRALGAWRRAAQPRFQELYSSEVTGDRALQVAEVRPTIQADAPQVPGAEILNRYFDAAFRRDPRVLMFGEDVGRLGGVNQSMADMQERHGVHRVSDTGIREATILGQAIGLALRGLRPIAEVQYLDYLLYALQMLSDDVATLRWRTCGGQTLPLIVRTRGHRLEGVWHSGSPMAGILHNVRGVHVCVPRDMTRACGLYNTLLQGDDPGLVVEVLNGYRTREPLPSNLADVTVPLGVPESLREGSDITLVTYGALCDIALEAATRLEELDVSLEVFDAQTLLPFDREHRIAASVARTNRLMVVDEDTPGGASAFMLQHILEEQGAYDHLDSPPRTLTAQPHRPAYGGDGNFFSKPCELHIVEAAYALMHESDPRAFPSLGF